MAFKIGQPRIESSQNETRLVAHLVNEAENYATDLFYSVAPQYAKYLCAEQADAFLVPILLRAVMTQQDIWIDAPISEKLLHNLHFGALYALTKAFQKDSHAAHPLKDIVITCNGTTYTNFYGTAVGTGCSLGVDSFAVIKKYLLDNPKDLPNYRISHFAMFNVGAFGSEDTPETKASFREAVAKTQSFADQLAIPLVSVDTNLHRLYPEHFFNQSVTYLNMGCVLALQKLWQRYLFASGFSVDNFEFNLRHTALFEPFLLPNLSTESTELICADMEKSRADKIKYIMDDKLVRENLNVCLKEQHKNNGMKHLQTDDDYPNCGRCEKCLRTMLQLEIYGRLNEFAKIFNLDNWNRRKPFYLAKVLARRKTKKMYDEIASTFTENYPISAKTRLLSWLYKLKDWIKPLEDH